MHRVAACLLLFVSLKLWCGEGDLNPHELAPASLEVFSLRLPQQVSTGKSANAQVGLGSTILYTPGNFPGGTYCYLHPSITCPSLCYNGTRIHQAQMKLHSAVISDQASFWGLSTATVARQVVAHEFGHILGLDEYTGQADCDFPTIMSEPESFSCTPKFQTPQTCDANAVASVYSSWTIYDWGTCGGACNTGASCN